MEDVVSAYLKNCLYFLNKEWKYESVKINEVRRSLFEMRKKRDINKEYMDSLQLQITNVQHPPHQLNATQRKHWTTYLISLQNMLRRFEEKHEIYETNLPMLVSQRVKEEKVMAIVAKKQRAERVKNSLDPHRWFDFGLVHELQENKSDITHFILSFL